MVNVIIGIIAYIVLAPFVGGFLAGVDRIVSARLQGRVGPPVLQPFYDVLKLREKEENIYRISLRSGNYVNVSDVCLVFGGGGHQRAAGATIQGTLEEVKDYCNERNNNVDAEQFIDYYETNGWVQGKGKPIKDWKACVRTWERNETNKQKEIKSERQKRIEEWLKDEEE